MLDVVNSVLNSKDAILQGDSIQDKEVQQEKNITANKRKKIDDLKEVCIIFFFFKTNISKYIPTIYFTGKRIGKNTIWRRK